MTYTTFYWTCPGCHFHQPVPELLEGLMECAVCERFAVNLSGFTSHQEVASAPLLDVNYDPTQDIRDGCAGCTPEEQLEYALRFPELDMIDRETRRSKSS